MLIVHPASTCDVCLDPYSWEAPGNCPHAIACGHVFCLNCLRSLDPSLCPLCRKAFDPSRIKKLHIDRYTPTDSQGMPIVGRTEEDELLHRIALFFGDSASDEDVNEVLEEVREWLASHTPGAHRTLQSTADALHRHRVLQQDCRTDKAIIENMRIDHSRRLRIKDSDLETAHAVEQNLLQKIHEIEDKHKEELEQAKAEIEALRIAQSRQPPPTIMNAPPSNPDFTRSLSMPNPLPQPPQPISLDRLAPFTVPAGAPSSTRPTSAPRSARTHSRHSSVHVPRPIFSQSEEDPNILRRDRHLVPPLLVPGAPPHEKVVPSPVPPPEQHANENYPNPPGRYPWFASPRSRSPFRFPPLEPANGNGNGAPLQSNAGFSYQYGQFPDGTYAWYAIPPSGTAAPPATQEARRGSSSAASAHTVNAPQPQASSANSMRSTHPPQTSSGHSVRSVRVHHARTASANSVHSAHAPHGGLAVDLGVQLETHSPIIEETPNALRIHGADDRPDSANAGGRHQEYARQSPEHLASPPAFLFPGSIMQATSAPDPNAGSGLGDISLLNRPPATPRDRRPSNRSGHRDIMDLLRNNSVPQVTQPSPASTWGTVDSARNSTNSSIGDLGLTGLPGDVPVDADTESESEDDDNDSDSDTNEGDRAFVTPRRQPLAYGRPEQEHTAEQPRYEAAPSDLGLFGLSDFDSAAFDSVAAPGPQVIRGQQGLQILADSLMQLAVRDNAQSPERRSTRSSASRSRDEADHDAGRQAGVTLFSPRPQSGESEWAEPSLWPLGRSGSSRRLYTGDANESERASTYSGGENDRAGRSGRSRDSRRQSTIPEDAVIPPFPYPSDSSRSRRPSTGSRVSFRNPPHETIPVTTSARSSVSSRPRTASGVDANGFLPAPGQDSLMLSFSPPSHTPSFAVRGRGEGSNIHAPAPRSVNSRHNNMFRW